MPTAPVGGMRSYSLLIVLLSSFAFLACSASSAEEDTDEGETRVTPQGDDSPGKLQVVAPTSATGLGSTAITYGNQRTMLGTLIDRVPVGTQQFSFASGGDGFQMQGTTSAAIQSGKTTTVTVAAISPDETGAPRTFGLGPNTTVQITGIGSGYIKGEAATGSNALALFGESVTFAFGLGQADGAMFKIAPGDVKKLAVWDVAQRRRAQLQAPASRDLPNAKCNGSDGYWVLGLKGTAVNSSLALKPGEAMEIGARNANVTYTFTTSLLRTSRDVTLGALGAAPTPFVVGRLDVDHVQLSGGGTKEGTYEVHAIETSPTGQPAESTNILRCAPATNTGVDLPSGKYKVIVSYTTVESGAKQDIHVVDVP
jgi:hypothetical protein